MIYLLIIFIIIQNVKDKKELQIPIIEEKKEKVLKLIREEKYEDALSITDDLEVKGRIKILQGKTIEGLLDIEKSALKGNVTSCNIFLLSKMEVPVDDLKAFIKMEFGIDTTIVLSSPYTKFLVYHPESLGVELTHPDSLLIPFSIFQIGTENLEKNREKAKEYFKRLIDEYPKSIPAIVARNLIRVLEEKENKNLSR